MPNFDAALFFFFFCSFRCCVYVTQRVQRSQKIKLIAFLLSETMLHPLLQWSQKKKNYLSGCFPLALFFAPGFAFALESGFGLAAAFSSRLAAAFSLKIALTSLRTSCAAFTASCTSETSEKISGILVFFSSSVALTKVAAPQVHAIGKTFSTGHTAAVATSSQPERKNRTVETNSDKCHQFVEHMKTLRSHRSNKQMHIYIYM